MKNIQVNLQKEGKSPTKTHQNDQASYESTNHINLLENKISLLQTTINGYQIKLNEERVIQDK